MADNAQTSHTRRSAPRVSTAEEAVPSTAVDQAALSLFQRYPIVCYLVALFVWSSAWWAAVSRVLGAHDPELQGPLPSSTEKTLNMVAAIGNMGPALTGIMCVVTSEGEGGLQRLGNMLFRRPARLHSFVVLLAVITMNAALFAYWQYAERGVRDVHGLWTSQESLRLARGWGLALTVAIAETAGWHAFLLPALLRSFPVHRAALLLGIAWGSWHALATLFGLGVHGPRYLSGAPLPIASLSLIPWALLHTYAYVESRGSLAVSAALTFVSVWSAIVFEAPFNDDLDSVRMHYATLSVLVSNVVALPIYILLQRKGVRDARRGQVWDEAEVQAGLASDVSVDADSAFRATPVDSNELRRRKGKAQAAAASRRR